MQPELQSQNPVLACSLRSATAEQLRLYYVKNLRLLMLNYSNVDHGQNCSKAVSHYFDLNLHLRLTTNWKRLQELEQARQKGCGIGAIHVGFLKDEGGVAHQVIGFGV